MIDKPRKGASYQTDLELMLRNRGIDTLFVCGVTTEVRVTTGSTEVQCQCGRFGDLLSMTPYLAELARGADLTVAAGAAAAAAAFAESAPTR